MAEITPFLWFDTEALDAAELYVSLFPNSEVTGVTYYQEGSGRPAGLPMVVSFVLDGRPYAAINGGPEHVLSEAFSMQVTCADQAEADRLWDTLRADGGAESQCGWCTDRFGLSWQVIPGGFFDLLGDPDPDRAQRALQAMLGMQRLDLAAMRAAVDQS